MTEERKRSIDLTIAAAKAQELRQRAANLPNAGDLALRLKAIEEAARRPVTAEEEPDKGEDIANELNALENEIQAREAKAKREQKKDMALINAVGDLADGLTK